MENQKSQVGITLFLSLLIFLSSFVFLSQALAPAGTIDRTVKQQILASLPPEQDGTSPATPVSSGPSQLFLTSPTGKYAAFLLRRPTVLGAGGFGNDFCYIQVQEAGKSVWESPCTPVSTENSCSLVFDDLGLEIYDGSTCMWNTNAKAHNFLQSLELVDSGDMRLIDKVGNLAWKASYYPLANQNCGSIGSPGLAPETPPFAKSFDNNGPFGQLLPSQGQLLPPVPVVLGPVGPVGPVEPVDGVSLPPQAPQGVPLLPAPVGLGPVGPVEPMDGVPPPGGPQGQVGNEQAPQDAVNQPISGAFNQPFSSFNQSQPFGGEGNYQKQPLVNNNPFDSGSSRESPIKFGALLVSLVTLLAYFGCFP